MKLLELEVENWRRCTYPEAACSPRPLEPPVTTATLPLRLKRFLKSRRSTSAFAAMMGD